MVWRGVAAAGYVGCVVVVHAGCNHCHVDCSGARHTCCRSVMEVQILRQRLCVAAVYFADCPARHHHWHRFAFGFQHHGYPIFDLDHRAGSRHFLHCRGLQQCAGPVSQAFRFHDRSVDGLGCRWFSNFSLRGLATNRLGTSGRRHVGFRPIVR